MWYVYMYVCVFLHRMWLCVCVYACVNICVCFPAQDVGAHAGCRLCPAGSVLHIARGHQWGSGKAFGFAVYNGGHAGVCVCVCANVCVCVFVCVCVRK